jgi:hypothetical protein
MTAREDCPGLGAEVHRPRGPDIDESIRRSIEAGQAVEYFAHLRGDETAEGLPAIADQLDALNAVAPYEIEVVEAAPVASSVSRFAEMYQAAARSESPTVAREDRSAHEVIAWQRARQMRRKRLRGRGAPRAVPPTSRDAGGRMIDPDRLKAFLDDLALLSVRHGLYLSGSWMWLLELDDRFGGCEPSPGRLSRA